MKLERLAQIDSLAIVGATGLVGREFLSILDEYKLQVRHLKLFGSERSAGEVVENSLHKATVEALSDGCFDDVQYAFFATPNDITMKYVPLAVQAGCVVFDDSNCFRMNPEVPLIVPEVNGSVLREFSGNLIATPNCSTTPLAVVLKPLLDSYGISRVVAATYQSVSGAGRAAAEELSAQCISLLNGGQAEVNVFPHPIAFNCIPQIGNQIETGDTDEEAKVGNELRKILGASELRVSATAVRVPTFGAHGIAANIEFERDFDDIETIRELLGTFPGLTVLDKTDAGIYPTNLECIGADDVFVGRIRRDTSVRSGINCWVMADNLRKGAALNVLQTMNTLCEYQQFH